MVRHPVTQGSTFASSTSTDELLPILEPADSGRESWTSCSSNSHDNFQKILNHHNETIADTINEVNDHKDINQHAIDSQELSLFRQSWGSSRLLLDRYKGNNSTVNCREMANRHQSIDPTYKAMTSSTEKGLIGEWLVDSLHWNCVKMSWRMASADFHSDLC